jgi:hypothetical protein
MGVDIRCFISEYKNHPIIIIAVPAFMRYVKKNRKVPGHDGDEGKIGKLNSSRAIML